MFRCPWRSGLRLDDFEALQASLIRKGSCAARSRATASGASETSKACASTQPPRQEARRRGGQRLDCAANNGEPGAALFWVSRNGATRRLLGNPHVNALIVSKQGVFAATGLDHRIDGSGQLLLIPRDPRAEWRTTPFADVGAVAYAATAAPDGLMLVVTRTQLVKVTPSGEVTVLHTGRWNQPIPGGRGRDDSVFAPSSIVLAPGGAVDIGMTGTVVVPTPSAAGGYREQWLAPRSCTGTTTP